MGKRDALEKEITRLLAENENIRESEQRYKVLFESIPASLHVVNADGYITDVNPFHVEHMGRGSMSREDYRGKHLSTRKSLALNGMIESFERVLQGFSFNAEAVFFPSVSGGGEGYFNIRGVPLKRNSRIVGALFISEDVTALKRVEAELTIHKEKLEELVQARTLELRDALSKVKTLSGLIPICASCKNVRNDQGYWIQVEGYLREHSDVEFSHGLCPGCMKKLYPDMDLNAP
jgi:PAS domain S-box-containing protein